MKYCYIHYPEDVTDELQHFTLYMEFVLIIYPRMTLSKRDVDFDSDKMTETDFAH